MMCQQWSGVNSCLTSRVVFVAFLSVPMEEEEGGGVGHKLRHNVIYTLLSQAWVDIFDVVLQRKHCLISVIVIHTMSSTNLYSV